MDDFTRCLRFIESLEERSGDRIEPFPWGRAFINTELKVVWDINFLRVERSGASFGDLAAAAERIQGGAGLGHRKLVLPDEGWAGDICNAARRSGWEVTPLIFMIRRREGTRTSSVPVREVPLEEIRPLREEMMRRQPWATQESDVQQVLEANRRWASRVDARFFIAEVDGVPAAACDLYQAPGLAQIEDVETKTEYRNRGLASAVVLAAADAAREAQGDPIVFLMADENDWPKVLYERMGFEIVGRRIQLLKTNL
jgi:ribosomal protein S18 acetylase RimI-like enzyme